MAGLAFIEAVRPVFNAGAKTLTFTRPASATRGRLLAIVLAFDPADDYVGPADWTVLDTFVGTAKLVLLAHALDEGEADEYVFALNTAAKDWLGQLVVLEHGALPTVLEAHAGGSFAADATPPAPAVACQQAINLDMRAWSVAGAVELVAPGGMEIVDAYSSALATGRSFLLARAVAGASGNLAAKDATAGAAATGSAVTYVLRDRAPVTPALLEDPVPGNIGFVGFDTRPPREAGLP